jgi:hypothetical protein
MEDRFTASHQTVVIWCLRDFCRNSHWNEDIFNQELRKRRQEELVKKRNRLREEEAALKQLKSSAGSSPRAAATSNSSSPDRVTSSSSPRVDSSPVKANVSPRRKNADKKG